MILAYNRNEVRKREYLPFLMHSPNFLLDLDVVFVKGVPCRGYGWMEKHDDMVEKAFPVLKLKKVFNSKSCPNMKF